MPKKLADLRQIAVEYRDHLIFELAKVDAFIEMAEELSDPESRAELGPFAGDAAALVLH